jgi:hypothetical protein
MATCFMPQEKARHAPNIRRERPTRKENPSSTRFAYVQEKTEQLPRCAPSTGDGIDAPSRPNMVFR